MTDTQISTRLTLDEALDDIPTFSPSQLNTWLDCRQKWKYAYVDELKRRSSGSLAMEKGTYFHKLAHYYYHLLQAGFRPGNELVIQTMQEKIKRDLQEVDENTLEIIRLAGPLFMKFIKEQSPIIDDKIKILEAEYEYFIPMVTPKGRPIFLHGIIDLVYRTIRGSIRVRDHKTSSRSNAWSQEALQLDPQIMFYNLVCTMIYDKPVEGAEVNFANMYDYKNPTTNELFKLYRVIHSKVELDTFKDYLLKVIDLILDGDVYRRYNKECSSCAFNKLCVLETKGLSTLGAIATEYERTNRHVTHENRPEVTIITKVETPQGRTVKKQDDTIVPINLSRRIDFTTQRS